MSVRFMSRVISLACPKALSKLNFLSSCFMILLIDSYEHKNFVLNLTLRLKNVYKYFEKYLKVFYGKYHYLLALP